MEKELNKQLISEQDLKNERFVKREIELRKVIESL